MKYKAICFFDLDGTLLNERSHVDEKVVEAIQKLKENNILPMIATGRALIEFENIREEVGINSCVALNGLHILIDGKTVYAKEFPKEQVQPLLDLSLSLNHCLQFFNTTTGWAHTHNQVAQKAFERLDLPEPKVDKELHKTEPILMPVLTTDEPETDHIYREAFPQFDFYRTTPEIMDVVVKDYNKGTGIKILLDLLDMADIPTYAFGDGSNDITMFQTVKYGVAMGNAIDELKELADYVSAENTQGGIVEALEYYGLI